MSSWTATLDETNKMHSILSPYIVKSHGNVMTGYDINENGETTGSKFFGANMLDMLRGAVEPVGTSDPNPYADVYAYAGEYGDTFEGEFERAEDEHAALTDATNALMTNAGLPTSVYDNAPTIQAVTVGDDGDDDELTLEYGEGVDDNYNAVINQYLAGMFEANAHTSSPFHIGLAMLLASKARQKSAFLAKLKTDRASRQAMVDVEVERLKLMSKLQWTQLSTGAKGTELQLELAQYEQFMQLMMRHWVAQNDRFTQDAAYNVEAVSWGFKNTATVAQMLNPVGTVPLGPPQPSRLQQGLAMALSVGGNIGMSIGDKLGPGAGIAAGILGGAASFGAALL